MSEVYIPPPVVDQPKTNLSSGKFLVPIKKIHNHDDLAIFLRSRSLRQYLNFIERMSQSIVSMKISDEIPVSLIVEKILDAMRVISGWVDEIPPIPQPMRYGNKAFRLLITKITENSLKIVTDILPEEFKDAGPELCEYWVNSWGNGVRIDYGTGHEMFFATFLCCLDVLGLTTDRDLPALTLRIFNTYLILMRKIQQAYHLEPAGSHGVWSLDDYQALPFLFGSAQLFKHRHISPKGARKQEIIENFSDEYIYFACIRFVLEMKTGPLCEHSPILSQASNLESWERVHSAMLKIYQKEVINNFPVMQHFLFGSIFPFP